jgi:1-aminocyclopropane-1-carboxylate deaminase/D-cysteine desulfhydrase-like pyridoxal-dependent ACC family enzyme
MLAQKEGVILDPVYSGKAFAGLLDLIRRAHFKESDEVVFLHTGGTAGLWAFADQLVYRYGGTSDFS